MLQISEEIYNTSLEFSKELVKHFNGLIRMVILFGSYIKGKNTPKSDIDLLVVVDDVYNKWDNLVRSYYYTELNKILSDNKFERIHVTTIPLSIFWKMVKVGDPLIISILRHGFPVIDSTGMFKSLQIMLQRGEIKPSEEAILAIKSRIPHHINMFYFHIAKAMEFIYWIFVESFQYLSMVIGDYPPSPDDIPEKYREYQKKYGKKLFRDNYLKWYKSVYDIVHKLAHREIDKISGETLDEWYTRAIDFKNAMYNIAKKIRELGGKQNINR